MEIGKLPNDVLASLVLEPIQKYGIVPEGVITLPSVGEDCAAIEFGEEICMLSTDPITGAAEDIGNLAVHINSNDIASAGGEVIGLMVTSLLPPTITEEEIAAITEGLYQSAAKAGIAILGGHTEITDAVTRPVLSCTAIGRGSSFISSGGAKAGDKVVMTKYAALEGSSIIYKDYKSYWLKVLSPDEHALCESLSHLLSVVPEGRIAAELKATSMHDVTEGGILGACHELAVCADKGITVYEENIPMLNVTKKLCETVGIDPLRLISSGSMLITTPKPDELIAALENEGIKATVIGEVTNGDMLIKKGNCLSPLSPPKTDELYKLSGAMEKLLK